MAFQTTEKLTKVTTRNVFCQCFSYPYLDSPQNCPPVLINFKAFSLFSPSLSRGLQWYNDKWGEGISILAGQVSAFERWPYYRR